MEAPVEPRRCRAGASPAGTARWLSVLLWDLPQDQDDRPHPDRDASDQGDDRDHPQSGRWATDVKRRRIHDVQDQANDQEREREQPDLVAGTHQQPQRRRASLTPGDQRAVASARRLRLSSCRRCIPKWSGCHKTLSINPRARRSYAPLDRCGFGPQPTDAPWTEDVTVPLRARAASKPSPAAVTAPSVGTARRAARGESTNSNKGTGSPSRSPSGPNGQSPPLVTTSTPSPTKAPIAGRNHRPRRPVSAHHHTYPIEARNPIAIKPCPARQTSTAGVIRVCELPAHRLGIR